MESLSLNLTHAVASLSAFDVAPQEFPESSAFFRAESQASGGKQFSNVRRFRAVTYYKDALTTEAGVASVGYLPLAAPHTVYGNLDRAFYNGICKKQNCLDVVGYSKKVIRGVASTPLGTLALTTTGVGLLNGTAVSFKGVNASDALGILSVEKHLILYTPRTIYHSSAIDMFDFSPEVEHGGTSYSVSIELGDIVTVVPYARGVYVLGTKGGAIGVCTGNISYPIRYEPILNFNGIYTPDNCVSCYQAETLYVYSRAGLQTLRGNRAENVYPDWSDVLKRNRWTSLPEYEDVPDSKQLVQPANPVWFDTLEVRDTFSPRCYKPIVLEHIGEPTCDILVTNVSPRYTTVSFANRTRLAVIDLYTERSTVLHQSHISVFPVDDTFALLQGSTWVLVVKGAGLGAVLFNDFYSVARNLQTIHKLRMFGMFRDDAPQFITFRTGADVIHTNSGERLEISSVSPRERVYTGFFRYNTCSFIVPWQGQLDTVSF